MYRTERNCEIKQWLLWSHVKHHLGSDSFTTPTQNDSQSIIHTAMHTLTQRVHLSFASQTNIDVSQLYGELVKLCRGKTIPFSSAV